MPALRTKITVVLISLVVLRVLIGFHFFFQGTEKIQRGDFSSAPFLRSARGPLAPWFHGLVDDFNGHQRLCVVETAGPDGQLRLRIDTQLTKAIWQDYVERAITRFKFDGSTARTATKLLNDSLARLAAFFEASHYVGTNEEEILVWAQGADRLQGFVRDGGQRAEVAGEVASLSGQIDSIRDERRRKAAPWLAQVEAMWDHLEEGINQLAGQEPGDPVFLIDRPYRERLSAQAFIDRIIPWFDLIVGGLLILGLLTRLAAVAGMALLLGVVATQPPWVLGSQDTFYQWIELAGLFVVCATAAGRSAGLDYFFGKRSRAADQDRVGQTPPALVGQPSTEET